MASHIARLVTAAKTVPVVKSDVADSGDIVPGRTAQALYIGGAGNLHYIDGMGTEIPLTAVVAGLFPFQVRRVYQDSTATGMLAAFDKDLG
jgi:hypothetical protein